MFLLAAEGGAHHTPLIVDFINHYLGEPVYRFQMAVTRPIWDRILLPFGTTPEAVFGEYSPETAIPWYTIMFVIACILTMVVVWILKGKLSAEDPSNGQLTLEAGVLALRGLVVSVIGEHGFKYFPVVGTFAVLVLISNLMGLFPLFMSPTASISVTLALGIASFIYYNYVGISENGLLAHLGHLTGPRLPLLLMLLITPLIFLIELFSNMIRPMTLGIRLFANMFADEQIAAIISGLFPPYTQILVPVILLPLALFVALVQTLVFTLLSMIYISEVSHAPHDHAHEHEIEMKETGETARVEYA
ncbi:MAG: ATP synthase F0 sector subunit a [uncultured Pyrinomonadaceae bacterium]|uniref:ATP synthase subunit a n=1 Tax=uncultured Pyrinomonadaceae bacterium TaxID=2283094 RepID=A0A6J4PV70_9BACT|nr:MAG: ATP synthase F0 sector subunit a [uncultured Pyrinomonadaceae bacterium]